jgi:hypothetical protein
MQSTTQPTQATAANPPRIEVKRVKLIDQNASTLRFQLNDGVVVRGRPGSDDAKIAPAHEDQISG